MRTRIIAPRWPSLAFAHDAGGGIRPVQGGGGGSSTLSRANEPGGSTLIQANDFASKPGNNPAKYQGWQNRDNDVNGSNASNLLITTDASAPKNSGESDTGVLRSLTNAGFTPGSAPIAYACYFPSSPQYNTIYMNFAVKHYAGWENDVGGAGVKFLWFHSRFTADYDANFYCAFNGPNLAFVFNIQGDATGAPNDGDGNRDSIGCNLIPSAGDFINYGAEWVEMEIKLRMNSVATVADGTIDTWIRGAHAMSHTDLKLIGTASRKWTGLRWDPTFGGGGAAPTIDIHQGISAFYISGS